VIEPRLLACVAAGAGTPYAWGGGGGSARWGGDVRSQGNPYGTEPTDTGRVLARLDGGRWVGAGVGYDCSGWVCLVLARLGQWTPRHLAVPGVLQACDPVSDGGRPGDVVAYGSPGRPQHVVILVDPRDDVTVGANGGGSRTHGNDPKARVRVESQYWRSHRLGVYRPRVMRDAKAWPLWSKVVELLDAGADVPGIGRCPLR